MINVSNKKFYVNFHVFWYSRDKLCHFAWDSHIFMFACHGKCFFFPPAPTTGSWRRQRSDPALAHLGKPWDSKNERRNNERVTNNFLTFQHDKSWTKVHKQDPEVRNMSVGLRTSNLLYHLASYFNFFSWLLVYRFAFYLLLSTSLLFRWKNPENKPRIVETAQQKVESAVKAERKGPKVLVFCSVSSLFMIKIFIWFSVPLLFEIPSKKTEKQNF